MSSPTQNGIMEAWRKNLIGNVLTINDAVTEDPVKRKAIKDLLVQSVQGSFNGMYNQLAEEGYLERE